jgi:ABC-type Fe3+-hydroxamate transport system substrate-binding protein
MTSRSFFDQLGNQITIPHSPQRIISLVPSQTELLYDLGLGQQVAGITKFCVHPAHWLAEKQIIGGTKNFRFDIIDQINPDLIIGNKEENYKEGIGQLQEKYPVWMSDIVSFYQAMEMISGIGAVTSKETKAAEIVHNITTAFSHIKKRSQKRVLYLIWRNPWMAAGAGTFIHAIIELLGLANCLERRPRYPELSDDEIRSLDPEVIFLSSEPYPFAEKHRDELTALCPSAKIMLVDGEMFSWYGSRLTKAPQYFNSLAL